MYEYINSNCAIFDLLPKLPHKLCTADKSPIRDVMSESENSEKPIAPWVMKRDKTAHLIGRGEWPP